MSKSIIYKDEARKKVFEGVDKLAKTVSVTMGPKGRNVIVGKFLGAPTITKDGVSVAREVVLSDPFEELGCQLVKEVAGRTADVAGDGTTTATVLAHEIFSQGIKAMDDGHSALDFRRGVEWALNELLDRLDDVAEPVETLEDLCNIATISANNDRELGNLIGEAYHSVGDNGLVTANAYPGIKDKVSVVDGIELNSGYFNRAFLDENKNDWAAENCYILICNREITHLADAGNLLENIAKSNKPLLIITKGLKKEAAKIIFDNSKRGRINVCVCKLPMFRGSPSPNRWLEDLAMMVGTRVVDEEEGIPLSEMKVSDLGFARQVNVDISTTKIVASKRNNDAIESRMKSYEEDIQKLIGERERRDIENRMNFLSSSAAVITIGYSTELELREKGDRVEDAMCAVRAAREEGYVPGGGTTLYKISNMIDTSDLDNRYLNGANALLAACKRPIKQILENAGENIDDILSKLDESDVFEFGYNVDREQFGLLTDMGVIDPKKVTKAALKNATTISLLLITTEAAIADLSANSDGWQPPAGYRAPGNGGWDHKY